MGGSEIYLRKIRGVLKNITVHGGGGGAEKMFLILLNFSPAHLYV